MCVKIFVSYHCLESILDGGQHRSEETCGSLDACESAGAPLGPSACLANRMVRRKRLCTQLILCGYHITGSNGGRGGFNDSCKQFKLSRATQSRKFGQAKVRRVGGSSVFIQFNRRFQ